MTLSELPVHLINQTKQSKLLTESRSQSLLIGPHRPLDLTHRAKLQKLLGAAAALNSLTSLQGSEGIYET